MTASEIVDRFGGTSALAKLLDLSISTVHSWRVKNHIPAWRQTAVLRLAIEKGISLSTADFPSKPARLAA